MSFRILLNSVAACSLALASFGGIAHAASIEELVRDNPGFTLEDDDAENVIQNDGNSTLDVGDVIRGVIEFPRFVAADGTEFALNGVDNQHLSAIFELAVTDKATSGGQFFFQFSPNAGSTFESEYGVGAMGAFFGDSEDDVNLTNCAPLATCEANVTDGQHLYTIGDDGVGNDFFWETLGFTTDDISAIGSAPAGTTFGNFNFGVDILFEDFGFDIVEGGQVAFNPTSIFGNFGPYQVDYSGDGSIKGGSGLTSYDVLSDGDHFFVADIPVPHTIMLLGFGLMGLGAAARYATKREQLT